MSQNTLDHANFVADCWARYEKEANGCLLLNLNDQARCGWDATVHFAGCLLYGAKKSGRTFTEYELKAMIDKLRC